MQIRAPSCATVMLLLVAIGGCANTRSSPYVGQEGRAIKSLSQKEAADLLDGGGMGYAKAAELNGYPGPSHVLELSAPLALTASQRAAIEAILKDHKTQARRLGREVVQLEQRLDALFTKHAATAEEIDSITARWAATAADLRASHLKAHVATTQLLTCSQVARYAELRGYSGAHAGHQPDPQHRPLKGEGSATYCASGS